MVRLLALSLLVSSAAFANDEDAQAIVQKVLVAPLRAKEARQSRFSRARMPPQARRVRMLEEKKDSAGETFFTFAVDSRYGFGDVADDEWEKDTTTGCVYVRTQEVFVKLGAQYRPAALLLGKKTDAADARVCKPGAELSAR